MNKEIIKEYIQKRTRFGVPTRPENIIRELRIEPRIIRRNLEELHREREIYLDVSGWKAN